MPRTTAAPPLRHCLAPHRCSCGFPLLQVGTVDCSYDLSKEDLLAKISLVDAIVIRSATKVGWAAEGRGAGTQGHSRRRRRRRRCRCSAGIIPGITPGTTPPAPGPPPPGHPRGV